ncbi:4Fe-4S dicluster domain-containing protein [Stakelama saccharophila]|uniref:4Fe-4S dicluster domain-containing protein n=1 Tax=Stakelama saccharophila TaxID=3075605 RepID=A0ABZ0B5Q1_9SPHN|nr:4Fe-4S dicluster domain-containing protein [Stakelama sp. W311]WNO52715.1 4Fe-4S dicluster domain-containing protein [Stakelama sp. W311]
MRLIAGGAAATVAGCTPPNQKIYPYVNQPEGTLPGSIRRYATTVPLAGYGRGVTGLVTDGRPIKLEGLETHPASLGATDLFAETALLDLYDPQRLQTVGGPPGIASWATAAEAIHTRRSTAGGEGIAILTGRITSPTQLRELNRLRRRFPAIRHVAWEPLDHDTVLAGAEMATGKRLLPRPRPQDADVILAIGADPLGPGPDQIAFARHWSERRRASPPPRLYVAEPSLTNTGAMADRRLALDPANLARLAHLLAAALGGATDAPDAPAPLVEFAAKAARDLSQAKGRALVLAGRSEPAEMHAFAAWANALLAAPLDWIEPVGDTGTQARDLTGLAADMHAGAIDTLIVLEANPVYAAPPALDFAGAMAQVPLTVTASQFPNETVALSDWVLPISHPLEEWNDWRGPDGTASIAQPLVQRFYDSRAASDVLALIGDPAATAESLRRVRTTWANLDDTAWKIAVVAGVVPDSAPSPQPVTAGSLVLPPIRSADASFLEIRPSPTLWDGVRANNAWAQECPDPISKEVWGASARLNIDEMRERAIGDGELIRIAAGEQSITLPARGTSGQARGVVTIMAGYGRHDSGAVADGIGENAWRLSGAQAVTLTPTGERGPTVSTQGVFALDGELEKIFRVIAPGEEVPEKKHQPTLLPNHAAKDAPDPQWAMTIDTDVCIGCNACVVACQAENNIPVIGPEEMDAGRDMHWLRVDRYVISAEDVTGFQPVPCMHCEKAPCEPVCPVEASVHNSEGLNLQVYNRCIGTRTCEANCPYKVRRFNFFDYSSRSVWGDADDASITAQRNPNVTVRDRGVMEKCTYCLQRISAAEHDADANGTPVGKVVTACQAACPTNAITFGSISDPDSAVSRKKEDPRHYAMLEDLGTKPRTTYLARTVNDEGEA